MAVVLGFRWRISGNENAPQMRDTTPFLPNETVGTLRRRLALECGSSAAAAAAAAGPELWLCNDDEEETPTTRQAAPAILKWTPTTCHALLFESYPSGRSKAVILFTFPPATTAAPAPAASTASVHLTCTFSACRTLLTGFICTPSSRTSRCWWSD